MNNRKVSLITGAITTAVLVGMVIYLAIENNFDIKSIILIFCALLSGAYSTYRLVKNSYTKEDLNKCEEYYKDVLKGVFESEEKVKARKDTILALYFYNYNMGVVSSFFKKLKRHAENRYEISLVYMLDTFYHLDMYNEEKAKESLRKIISVDSQNADALHLLYLLEYDGENEKEEFFEKLKNALSINKENPYILNSCASICVQLKKYDEGIEYANRAIKVDGSLCQPYSILSLAYAGLKNDTESEKYKNQAVSKGADGEIIDLYINDINEGVELCCAYDDSEDVFVYNNYKMK